MSNLTREAEHLIEQLKAQKAPQDHIDYGACELSIARLRTELVAVRQAHTDLCKAVAKERMRWGCWLLPEEWVGT